jgi:hypothetical protein
MASDGKPVGKEASSPSSFAWLILAALAAWLVIGGIVAAIFLSAAWYQFHNVIFTVQMIRNAHAPRVALARAAGITCPTPDRPFRVGHLEGMAY